jgi:hypothetical protein
MHTHMKEREREREREREMTGSPHALGLHFPSRQALFQPKAQTSPHVLSSAAVNKTARKTWCTCYKKGVPQTGQPQARIAIELRHEHVHAMFLRLVTTCTVPGLGLHCAWSRLALCLV